MTHTCNNCGTELTKENQKVGYKTSSQNGSSDIFTTKCHECGEDQSETVKELLQQEN